MPISFLLTILFHGWVRNSFISHLPPPLDIKFAKYLDFDFTRYLRRHWLVFTLSVVLGSLSHLAWDVFTYPEGVVYQLAPSFFGQVIRLGGSSFQLSVLIERTGSVLGLAFVIWIVFREPKSDVRMVPLLRQSKLTYWLGILFMALLITTFKLILDGEFYILGHVVVVGLSAALYAFAFVSALFQVMAKPH